MGLGLGLRLGLGGAGVLGPALDPDALTWFEAVEATGATFGPDSATVSANKTAWSDWVIAQKNAESPIAGRSNWQQLTQADEGFIQPLMGVSTFNIPALFGDRDFVSFVAGDYLPAMGLKGGSGRVLFAIGSGWNSTPLNDFSIGMWATEASGSADSGRVLGGSTSVSRTLIRNDTDSMAKSAGITDGVGPNYQTGTFPRSAFLSRSSPNEYTLHNGVARVISSNSATPADVDVTFFAWTSSTATNNIRGGLVFYGRSIDLEVMNTACVALSEAIAWP